MTGLNVDVDVLSNVVHCKGGFHDLSLSDQANRRAARCR